jgi:hypothetical protein
MDQELVASEVAYPSEEVLARGQSFLNLSTETTQLMDSLWLNVKTNDNNSALIYGAIGLIVIAAILAFSLSAARRSLKKDVRFIKNKLSSISPLCGDTSCKLRLHDREKSLVCFNKRLPSVWQSINFFSA